MPREENLLKRRDLDSLTAVERAFQAGPLAESLDRAPVIERRRGLAREEFEHEYREQGRPVVLEGFAADWPSVRTWPFDGLAQRSASVPSIVASYSSQPSP